ncbi:MAG: hypothetical protein ACYDCC_15810 [Actinomycetota bacterium]
MRRRTFDSLMSMGGLVLTIVLVVAGVLAFVGYDFANNAVHTQLAAQHITMPSGAAIAEPAIHPYLAKYAGEQMVNGAQAEAYADHFIAVHLQGVAGGNTYSEESALAIANPTDATIAAKVQTLFRGETLRGLLLQAYAFWKIGQIALVASIASFALALVMALLTILGFVHLRKVAPTEELQASRFEFAARKSA